MSLGYNPGDLVYRFAHLHSWPIASRSLIVEGEHDQRYFKLADKLYYEKTGLSLLGEKCSVFPTGIGNQGGSFGIQQHFHPLRAIMDIDVGPSGNKVFHAIALFDKDLEGNRGVAALTGQHLKYKKWRDVFSLRRVLPRTTRDLVQLTKLIEEENASWKDFDCEIEDLVSIDVIKAFSDANPGCFFRSAEENAGGSHYYFKPHMKADFVRFVENYALLQDVIRLVELLKSLRYHLGINPEGDPL